MNTYNLLDFTEDQVEIIKIALESYRDDLYAEFKEANSYGDPSPAYEEWLQTCSLIKKIEKQV